jgi:multidrug resistance efflux pump
MKRGVLLAIGGVLLAAGGAGGYLFWKSKQAAPVKKTEQAQPQLAPGTVVKFQATLAARNVVGVDAPVDGVLEEFPVKPGDEVFEGQILGSVVNDVLVEQEKEAGLQLERMKTRLETLESQMLAARLEESSKSADASRAASERQRAERVFQRQQMLHREGATARKAFESSQAAFDAAKAEEESVAGLAKALRERVDRINKDIDVAKRQVAEAEAAYEEAKVGLAAAQLLSPVDGVVVGIQKQAGEEVKAGTEGLIQIAVDLTMMEAVFDLEAGLAGRIVAGMPAQVNIAETADALPGQVRLVENNKAYVEFASPTPLIRPGMTATVSVQIK